MSKEFVSITLVFESAESMIIPADKIIFLVYSGCYNRTFWREAL